MQTQVTVEGSHTTLQTLGKARLSNTEPEKCRGQFSGFLVIGLEYLAN